MPRQALIVGLGLIGGSIALRLKQRGWHVEYIDKSVNIDEFDQVNEIDDRSLVIVATPVDAAVALLRDLQPRSGAVTTVCSVMRPVREVATTARFVAGHPIAGSEKSGFAAADPSLFEGKPWFLDAQDEDVEQLVHDCGANLERTEAAEHDQAVALTSHLPQVLSTALGAMLADREDVLRYAGTGLKTFLRLAGSGPEIWKPVLEANRENIAGRAEELERIVRDMLDGDMTAFEKARRMWRRL